MKYKIIRDTDAESPRDDDNVGTMHCGHQRYTLGDKDAPTPFVDDDYRAKVQRPDVLTYLPIYMYDHSGLAFSHTPFHCPWDSGLLGWHYVTREKAAEAWPSVTDEDELIERAVACMNTELEAYGHFISGEVYGYQVINEDGEEIDSCWGFIGDDIETNGMLDIGAEHAEGLRKAWEER